MAERLNIGNLPTGAVDGLKRDFGTETIAGKLKEELSEAEKLQEDENKKIQEKKNAPTSLRGALRDRPDLAAMVPGEVEVGTMAKDALQEMGKVGGLRADTKHMVNEVVNSMKVHSVFKDFIKNLLAESGRMESFVRALDARNLYEFNLRNANAQVEPNELGWDKNVYLQEFDKVCDKVVDGFNEDDINKTLHDARVDIPGFLQRRFVDKMIHNATRGK